ncbi:RNA polymerase sigma factor [Kribbella sp. NBC_01245]|uniref:RNA polymerase sigma factor n=1 Tax=Kribbella sp. NBC_01245 TaxID=2903578 RepID=UPI002E2B899A|nr:RNA polymerase sigma factor [Kribbella sp. NBC_01245]
MTSTPSPPRPVPLRAVSDQERRFRELFAGNSRELLGFALRRVGSPEDAADIVADTMLVAWRRIGDVPVDGTARLWLYGVARHVIANHRRGQTRRERLGERLRNQLAQCRPLAQVTPDPADAVDSTTVIRAAMAGLSEGDRELLMLTGWEGLDPREVAIVLGLPARTVRTRLHRARTRLRKSLGDAFELDGHVREDQHARPIQEER